MTDRFNNTKPNIAIEGMSVYSASFAAAKVSPVSLVAISDLPHQNLDGVSIEILCTAAASSVLSYGPYSLSGLNTKMFSDSANSLGIRFSYDELNVDEDFLDSVENTLNTEITVRVTLGEAVFEHKMPFSIVPKNEFSGIQTHPETLACFVSSAEECISEMAESIKKVSVMPSYNEVISCIRDIVKSVKMKNVICTAKDSYSPDKKQIIKSHDTLFSKSSVVATPAELAVLFCACAERCGLKPVIVYVGNKLGGVSMFCGARTETDERMPMLSESMSKLRKMLEAGELILFDPAILSSAQNVDPALNCVSCADVIGKASSEMLFMLDIEAARKNGVKALYGSCHPETIRESARDTLADIYTGITNRPVFRLLKGDYSGYDVLPIVNAKFDAALPLEKSITVKPLDLIDKPAVFAGLVDGFASFAVKDIKPKSYNKAESRIVADKLAEFAHRITSRKSLVAGLYENAFHPAASRMTFGNTPGMKIYMIGGFLRIADKEAGEYKYLPLSFTEVKVKYNDGAYTVERTSGEFLPNTYLCYELSKQNLSAFSCDTPKETADFFENIISGMQNSIFSDMSVIREIAFVKADLSDFIFWNDTRKYAKTMLSSKSFSELLTAEKNENNDKKPKYLNNAVLPHTLPSYVKKAVMSDENTVICASSAKDSFDVLSSVAARSIDKGEKLVIASSNNEFLDGAEESLSGLGFDTACINLSKVGSAYELAELAKKRIDLALSTDETHAPYEKSEFINIKKRIVEYASVLNKTDSELGISLIEAASSYYGASETLEDGSELDVLPEAYNDMSWRKLNKLFDLAEKLICAAKETQNTAGLNEAEPLKENPLYLTAPQGTFDDEQISAVNELVARILPAISENRENFSEIADDLGFKHSDICTLDDLLLLNELYRLIISAREIDIPDDFTSYDISGYADDAERVQRIAKRKENIEYQLRFFSSEIFEDADSLLSGYDYKGKENRNIIKKFLVQKNNKDVLLQYVQPQNKQEFYKHDVEEIYRLLDEYRSLLKSKGTPLYEENTLMSEKLSGLAKSVGEVLCGLCDGISDDVTLLNAHMAKIFEFISKVSRDAGISRKLTYARAHLAQVISDNECLLSRLKTVLGADFSHLRFENGILDYDGLGKYLRTLDDNLPAMQTWQKWLEAKKDACEFIPSFAEYLENNGIKANTDRIFASSLLLPCVETLLVKNDFFTVKESFDKAKDVYFDVRNSIQKSYCEEVLLKSMGCIKDYATANKLDDFYTDTDMPISKYVRKYKDVIVNIFPIVLVSSLDAGAYFEGECLFDTLIGDDNGVSKYNMLVCTSLAKRKVMLSMYGKKGFVTERLEERDTHICNLSYMSAPISRKLATVSGKSVLASENPEEQISVITVNGSMRRVTDLANPAEAELCVAKAAELASKSEMPVVIFAFTHGQCAYIRHLVAMAAENDKNIEQLNSKGLIKVREAYIPCFEKYQNTVVSLGAALDKNGNVGWSFSSEYESFDTMTLLNIANASSGKTVFVSSFNKKDLEKLRRTSVQADRLCFVNDLAAGVLSLDAAVLIKNSDTPKRAYAVKLGEVFDCAGYYNTGADLMIAENGKMLIYDCLPGEDIFDKLDVYGILKKEGADIEIACALDGVLKRIGNN